MLNRKELETLKHVTLLDFTLQKVKNMRKRRLSRKADKRNYKRGNKVHRKNKQIRPMRGGIRL